MLLDDLLAVGGGAEFVDFGGRRGRRAGMGEAGREEQIPAGGAGAAAAAEDPAGIAAAEPRSSPPAKRR